MTESPLAHQIESGGSASGSGNKRPFRLIAVLGAPASGKSTLMQELVDETVKAGRDARVLDPAGNWPEIGEWPEKKDDVRSMEAIADDWLSGILRERAPHRDSQGRARIQESLRPCFLVGDDLDTYSSASARGAWRRLFTTYRHFRLDVAVSARRSQDTPKIVFTSATFVYVFRHFVSTDYLREHYGPELVRAIPEEPFKYALFNCETREIIEGATKPRKQKTTADG